MLKREKEVIQYQLDNEKEVIAALEREYEKALWHINQRIRMYQADEQTLSRIHHINYQKELRRQVEAILERLHSGEYETINQYLTDTYTDAFVGTMYSLAGQGVPVIAPLDRNAMVKAVLTDSKISEGLYTSLGVDTRKLKKAISSEISRGLSSGMAYADIARNIATVTGAPKSRAKAIVRTEGHRIQQASTQDAAMASKARGANVKKQWDSTLDGGTRPTHRRLDGQIRDVEEPFSMDGKTAMHPGDFGDPAEDCECRCVELIRATKALDASELERLKERAKYFELDKTEDFEDFKEKYLKAAETEVKPTKSSFVPAKTKVEAEKYAAKFADKVSYTGVSLENANKINEQLTELVEKYPINQLEEIRTGAKGSAAANYRHLLLGRNNLGKALDDGYQFFLKSQEEHRESLKIIREKYAGKKLPFAIEKTIKTLEDKLKFSRYGVHEAYTEHVKITIIHEYGHIIADQYFGQINGEAANPNIKTNWSIRKVSDRWKDIFKTAYEKGDIYKVSQYGATDHKEFFAECFAARELGEKLPGYIDDFFMEVLKNGIMH